MRHRKSFAKLNRTAEHRKATLANLASALIEQKKIKTTHAKAKATQRFVEHLVTLAKKRTLNSRRLILSRLRDKEAMFALFDEIAPGYAERNGGYTRVIHLGRRLGDGAEMSLLEFVGFETVTHKHKKEEKKTHKLGKKKAEKEKAAEEAQVEKAAPAEAVEEEKPKEEITPVKEEETVTKAEAPEETGEETKQAEAEPEPQPEPESEPESEKKEDESKEEPKNE
ncbi:50S ribosomal protein L17 [bacterium BMS3Abin05]|nr:50S ribosomal protein L17 [bacterium BMS3Abin05]